MSEPTTALATLEYDEETGVIAEIERLKTGQVALFNSIGTDSEENADATLVAMSNAEDISDHFGETINLRHVIVEKGRSEDPDTGEVSVFKRIYLIDEDGSSYVTTSDPVFNELERIIGVRGPIQGWKTAYPVVVTLEGKAPRAWHKLSGVARPKVAAKK